MNGREVLIWLSACIGLAAYGSFYLLCPDFWREDASTKLAYTTVEFFSVQAGFAAWNMLPGVLLCLVGRKHTSARSAAARLTGALSIGVGWAWLAFELWHTSTVCMGLGWELVFWPLPLWLACGIALIVAVIAESKHRNPLRELGPS